MPQNTANGSARVQVASHIERELFEKFEGLAKRNERSIAAELRLAIRAHLAKEDELSKDFLIVPAAEKGTP
jgi:hypothetical protein